MKKQTAEKVFALAADVTQVPVVATSLGQGHSRRRKGGGAVAQEERTSAPTEPETESRLVTSVPASTTPATPTTESQAADSPPTKPMSASVTSTSLPTKAETVLKKLRAPRGTTLSALMQETGWQAHSVRGFLSGTIRKKLGLNLTSAVGKDGVRRYRVAEQA